MKYYLIIIAMSVWQEIEFLLENCSYPDTDAVEEKINTLARDNGIDYDFTCKVKEYHFAEPHDARVFRDGAMAVFDDQEDSGEGLELALINENGNIVTPEL